MAFRVLEPKNLQIYLFIQRVCLYQYCDCAANPSILVAKMKNPYDLTLSSKKQILTTCSSRNHSFSVKFQLSTFAIDTSFYAKAGNSGNSSFMEKFHSLSLFIVQSENFHSISRMFEHFFLFISMKMLSKIIFREKEINFHVNNTVHMLICFIFIANMFAANKLTHQKSYHDVVRLFDAQSIQHEAEMCLAIVYIRAFFTLQLKCIAFLHLSNWPRVDVD